MYKRKINFMIQVERLFHTKFDSHTMYAIFLQHKNSSLTYKFIKGRLLNLTQNRVPLGWWLSLKSVEERLWTEEDLGNWYTSPPPMTC